MRLVFSSDHGACRNTTARAIAVLGAFLFVLTGATEAAVKIIVEDLQLEPDYIAAIKYDSTQEAQLVRAFALDLKVIAGYGNIIEVNDFAVGADCGGYGIFPANFSRYITVDPQTGEVGDWNVPGYTPVADGNDPGSAGGLGGSNITIEMGSLYTTKPPGKTGMLCKVRVRYRRDEQVTGQSVVVKASGSGMGPCPAPETRPRVCVTTNALRGGVVLEDGREATVDLTQACVTLGGSVDCFPYHYSTCQDWAAMGKPSCWCNKYQCDGDTDGKDSSGLTKFRVFTGDLALLVANWQKRINDKTLNPCADIDHRDSGGLTKFRVFTGDLYISVTNWQKKDGQLPGNCPRWE